MRKLRHMLEYAGLRVAFAAVDAMSLDRATRVARAFARAGYRLADRRRALTCDNIRRAGIATSEDEVARLGRASFEHFATVAVEVLKAPRLLSPENWPEHITFRAPPETQALLREDGKGVIVVSGHVGNWEIGGEALSFLRPTVAIVRNMNNPYTDRLIRGRNPRPDLQWVPKYDLSPRRLVRALKDGKILVIMADQHARRGGVPADFFGRPASTYTTPAILHLLTRAPILCGVCLRTGPMTFEIQFSEPLAFEPSGNREQDARTITRDMNRRLEDYIRQAPDQYLWVHRRWKLGK